MPGVMSSQEVLPPRKFRRSIGERRKLFYRWVARDQGLKRQPRLYRVRPYLCERNKK
jgi:hypothetical protein